MKLLENCRKERRTFGLISGFLGYGATLLLILYILILIFMKNIPLKYSAIPYYIIFCRLSAMVTAKYYEIPEIVLMLNSEKHNPEPFRCISENREEILHPMFKRMFGIGYDRNYLNLDSESILKITDMENRSDWKKIGKFYFFFFLAVTAIFLYIISE